MYLATSISIFQCPLLLGEMGATFDIICTINTSHSKNPIQNGPQCLPSFIKFSQVGMKVTVCTGNVKVESQCFIL